MSTRKFVMPRSARVGQVGQDGGVVLDNAFHKYLGGIEDVSGRVCENLDGGTATSAQIVSALKAAGLMKAD